MSKFSVIKSDHGKKFTVTGFNGFKVSLNNKHDAYCLCGYLNRNDELMQQEISKNVEYYNVLTEIKRLVEKIQYGTGEIHILELAIKIKNLLKEVL